MTLFSFHILEKVGQNREGEILASPQVPELLESDACQVISRSIDVSYFFQLESNTAYQVKLFQV